MGCSIDVSLTAKIIQNFVHMWIVVAALIEPLHVAIFTTRQRNFGKEMFSQVCVILSTEEMVSGYAWYQVPSGVGWVYKREGYMGLGILGYTMGWELRVGIPRRRVKQREWVGMTWYTHSPPPWCWHLVMASEAGGTHPTGMLSFFSAESWGGSTTSPGRTGTSSSTAKHATSAGHRSWSTPEVCHLFLVSVDIKFASCSPVELDTVPISGFEIKVEGILVEVIFKFIKIDSGSWVSLQNLNTVNLCFTVRMLWGSIMSNYRD